MQHLRQQGLEWDQELPPAAQEEWVCFFQEMGDLNEMTSEISLTQSAKKVIFTACHSGKLKLIFANPNIISNSPQNVLMSMLISQFFCNLNSSKKFTRHQYGISALVSRTSLVGKPVVASPIVGCFVRLHPTKPLELVHLSDGKSITDDYLDQGLV